MDVDVTQRHTPQGHLQCSRSRLMSEDDVTVETADDRVGDQQVPPGLPGAGPGLSSRVCAVPDSAPLVPAEQLRDLTRAVPAVERLPAVEHPTLDCRLP